MILAVRYSIKGVKKAHKSYKKRQAEKEQQLLTDRGQLPDLQDPSRELDASCLADTAKVKSSTSLSSTSSTSNASAEQALENDPSFREYMEKQKSLYLKHHKSNPNPPSYTSVVQQGRPHNHHTHTSPHSPTTATTLSPTMATLSPTSSTGHCSCHECVAAMNSPNIQRPVTPIPNVPELPSSANMTAAEQPQGGKISELSNSQTQPVEIMSQEDDHYMAFELPGNMPAMLPPMKQQSPVELPSEVP